MNASRPGGQTALWVDSSVVLIDGPWEHRFIAAHGARFHVVQAGPADGPLVLMLHGFPQFWWCWRAQIAALARAGYRAVAMDLRGYGGSDKPPRGYDTPTLAADVAGVIRSLGAVRAVVAGHDWGGWVAWSMPTLQPAVVRAVAAVSAAHPLQARAALRSRAQRHAGRHVVAFQVPMLPERALVGSDLVARLLRGQSATPGWPDDETVDRYSTAIRVPFVAHSAMEYFRWVARSLARRDGRRFAAAVDAPIRVPVLHLHGERDPVLLAASVTRSRRWVEGPYTWQLIGGAGHYLPEEASGAVSRHLLDWLGRLDH